MCWIIISFIKNFIMETISQIKKSFLKNSVVTLLTLTLLINGFSAFGQKNKNTPISFGAGIGTHISGNSLGGFYSLNGDLYKNKNIISLGLCIQNRSEVVNGIKIGYSRILSGVENFSFDENSHDNDIIDRRFQLYFFSTLQYTKNAHLSKGASLLENKSSISKDNDKPNYSKAKLTTIEACVGFGLNTKIGKNIIWSNYIGLCSYLHTNYINGMYIDKSALALTLGTTIGVKFFGN